MLTKKTIGIIIGVTLAVIIVAVVWGMRMQSQKNQLPSGSVSGDATSDIIFYYGQECSHCKNTEKFIADNQVTTRISLAQKEVWHDDANRAEMAEKAAECSLDPAKVGVPFLWVRGKCFIGETEVENFLKKEAGINK